MNIKLFLKILLVGAASVVFGFANSAGEILSGDAAYSVIHEALVEPAPEVREVTVTVTLVLTNRADHTLKIPADLGRPYVSFADGNTHVHFRYHPRVDSKNRRIIPSEFQFKPVVLGSGESTQLDHSFNIPHDHKLGEMAVTYEIPEFLKKRFGFWSGKLKVPVEASNPIW
jgi:hypothetical protein